MTPTSHAAQAGFDLDKLEALARAATPGPWDWWTSNSTLRLTGADGRDGGVLHGYVHSGCGDVSCSTANQAFIAAANPAAVLALISLARNEAQAAPAADERTTLMAPCEGGPILPDSCSDCRREGSTCAIAALAQQAASPAPETAQADDEDHPALMLALEGILTQSGWGKYRANENVLSAEDARIIFKAGQAAHAQQDAAPAGWFEGAEDCDGNPLVRVSVDELQAAAEFIINAGMSARRINGVMVKRSELAARLAPSAATGKAAAAAANAGELADCLNALRTAWHISGVVQGRQDIADAIARAESALATSAADAKDAERWRALIGSSRIRPLGSAGLNEPMPGNYAHLGLEIWTTGNWNDCSVNLAKKLAYEQKVGIEWLTKYADIAIAAQRTAIAASQKGGA